MSNINNTSVLDLLPSNLKQDPTIKVASQVVDARFVRLTEPIERLLIFYNLHLQDDAMLDYLLYERHITNDEGASLVATREEKINLIEKSYSIHRIKGTKAALVRVLNLLNMRGKVSQWFEYDGDPYYFKIDIEIGTRGMDDRTLLLLDNLIHEYKNRRSWIEKINLHLSGQGKLFIGANLSFGEEITVYPWSPTNIETKGYVRIGSYAKSFESLSVYPEGGS